MTDIMRRPDGLTDMSMEAQPLAGVDPGVTEYQHGLAARLGDSFVGGSFVGGVGHLMLAGNAALSRAIAEAPADQLHDPRLGLEHHARKWAMLAALGINSPDLVEEARKGDLS